MKKAVIVIFKLFAIAIITLLLLIIVKKVYIMSAEGDFKHKNYQSAANKYEFLLSMEPQSEKYQKLLADSLVQLPFTYENQKRICDFLELYKGKYFAYPLEEKLARFKSTLDSKIGINYIYKALMNNQILRWEDDAFPLKVYIPNRETNGYAKSIKRAFEYWAYATSNFVSFAFIDSESGADIVVNIIGSAKSNCESEGCHFSVAVTSPETKGSILKGMSMKFSTSDPYGRQYNYEYIYKVALHEIGHALGIMGHSDNPANLMYASGNQEANSETEYRSALTREDLNTLSYLYMLVPDISNKPHGQRDTTNKIHPPVILGTTKEIQEKEIQDAKNYIAKAPNLAVGYLALGNAYFQADRYDDAIKTYTQGYKLSVDSDERYMLVYNMAVVLLKMKNRDKALEYAKLAKQIKQTDEITSLIHDIKYPFSLSEPSYYE